MDSLTPEKRSWNMSQIPSNDTKLEEFVRKAMFSKGLRYRKNVKALPGKPDIVFSKYTTVVFVNGCFWHMHEGCKAGRVPKSNVEFWENKLLRNKERDQENYKKLNDAGWRVIVLWECELKPSNRQATLEKLFNEITSIKLDSSP